MSNTLLEDRVELLFKAFKLLEEQVKMLQSYQTQHMLEKYEDAIRTKRLIQIGKELEKEKATNIQAKIPVGIELSKLKQSIKNMQENTGIPIYIPVDNTDIDNLKEAMPIIEQYKVQPSSTCKPVTFVSSAPLTKEDIEIIKELLKDVK